MKKMLFVLTALALPITAHAEKVQPTQKTVPEATIQAAIKEFVDTPCSIGIEGLIDNVQQCFKETSENSPNIDKCVIGHYVLFREIQLLRDLINKTNGNDPTKNISFVNPQVTHDRGVHYTNLPRYENIDVTKYFSPAIHTVFQKYEDHITACHPN